MFAELVQHCAKSEAWASWDGVSLPCVRVGNVNDWIGFMRRLAWQAGHQFWRSCEWVPKPFEGVVTETAVDQYLVGLDVGIKPSFLKKSR